MNIKAAIFDFDGTLFDSMPVWKGLKFKFFESMGIVLTDEDKKIFSGLFLSDALPLAKERFHLNENIEELYSSFWKLLTNKYLELATPKNNVIEFLKQLENNGIKMGIATATDETAIIPLLEKYDMLKYFACIYSTYTVNAPKSSPKIYDTVCRELCIDKSLTWVFEDALYAAKTAKENGYNVVGIYDNSEQNQYELKQIVDIFIYDYNEIII